MSDDDIAALHTLLEGFENRPKNTNLAYNKKAVEFSKWCIEVVGYPDGATVSGSKLHCFLCEQVCNRTSRKDKHKQIGFVKRERKIFLVYIGKFFITGITQVVQW